MAAAKKINFTKVALDAVACPSAGRVYVYDVRTPGLALCVTARGARAFYSYRWVNGGPQRIRLGGYPDVTIEQARRLAAAVSGDVARGVDPRAERRRARERAAASRTLGHVFADYIEGHAKPHKKSWADDQRQFDRYLSDWKDRPADAVTVNDVQALHARVGERHGRYAANRLVALLSKVFNVARLPNPAAGVRKFRERSRERFVGADELPAFFRSLADEPNEVLRDFFLVALLTGARRANVQAMRWADVRSRPRRWCIAGTEAKGGDALTVYLSAAAVAVLARRRRDNPRLSRGKFTESPYVFPGHGRTGHLAEPKSAWKRILKRAGIADLRIHDLRRTMGSWQAATGASLPVIGKTLGHKNVATTAVYARLSLDPARVAVDAATAAMLAVAGPKALAPGRPDAKPATPANPR